LLELGMGFHPDFTGRQNAYMGGQLLGYAVEEIAALMPGIEAFADIGEYIDQPVRMYSSGMQVRLAFSVATAVRPDVLIVDEALSVGDAYFQAKCYQRINQFKEQGHHIAPRFAQCRRCGQALRTCHHAQKRRNRNGRLIAGGNQPLPWTSFSENG
jgi:ABC-type polysaccharide/polyol phosphate transport system ATPase subunit